MGTRTATADIKLNITTAIQNTGDDGEVATAQLGDQSLINQKLATGVSLDQVNRVWQNKTLVILSGSTVDIDLYDFVGQDTGFGDGRDAVGQLLTVEEIVTIVIKQLPVSTGRCEIMATLPANPVTWLPVNYATLANDGALKNNEVFFRHRSHTDAFDIQDGVAHMVRLGAVSGDVTLQIHIIGRHDDDESSSTSSSSSSSSSTSTQSSLSSSSSSTVSSSSSTSTQSTLSSSTLSSSTLSTSTT